MPTIDISFAELAAKPTFPAADTIVIAMADDKKSSALAHDLDRRMGGALRKALGASKFMGKKGQHFTLPAPAGLDCDRLVVAGIGKPKALTALGVEEIGGALVPALNTQGTKSAAFLIESWAGCPLSAAACAAHLACGASLRAYRFDKYRTKDKPEDKPTFARLALHVKGAKQAQAQYVVMDQVNDGVFFTRDLVTEPANVINPETLAERCLELRKLGVAVEILGVAQMKKLGMNALLGVGQGSVKESKLVVMQWKGAGKSAKGGPVAFVGKGVTFDTGGISIKPANGMEEMKWDMGGAGTVIGLMRALARRKAKVNAVGIAGLVENMPDGNAQRPGDVVQSMSGQTIEVLNTDAEGRLVLADALWYTQERFKPRMMIDLATLTGAVIVALGHKKAGLFSTHDKLVDQLVRAGDAVGEEVWRLPLGDYYDKLINCDIADMKNVVESREAGSTTAAQFLKRFVKDDLPWAHLDIAGVAWTNKPQDLAAKGATAFGVRLLDRLVAKHYEG